VRKSKQISVYRGLILFHRKHPDERLTVIFALSSGTDFVIELALQRRASLIDC